MGLAVDHKSRKIHRLDLQNDKVIYVSPGWGTGIRNGRFSPDGSKIVTINSAKKVEIRSLNGNVTKSFTTFVGDDGHVSWTNSGIWVGGIGKLVRYDTAGIKKETVTLKGGGSGSTAMTDAEAAETRVKFVSHNDKTAGGRPKFAASILLDQRDSQNRAPVIKLGSGCSVGPSPDGTRLTRNLWELKADCKATNYTTDCKHQTMKIHKRTGEQTHYIYIYNMIPEYKPASSADYIDPVKGWTFNTQTWSSNSNSIIVVPAGHCYPQMADDKSYCSTIPWIYNLSTQKATCLYTDKYAKGMWWYPTDYYSGKVGPQPDCTGDAQCNDNNPCTNDKCSGGNCSNTAIADCCTTASQCNDSKVCTKDTCDSNKCQNTAIADCCTSASQCNDSKVCTKDVCTANKCQNTAIADCCTAATQCDDDNVCTKDTCGSNTCENAAIAGCCKKNSDCADSSPCTADSCKVATGECINKAIVDCCVDDPDCDDDDPCTQDSCSGDNTCSNAALADCCHGAGDCGTDTTCTTYGCESNLCVEAALPNCCTTAADCNDEDDCTTDSCEDGGRCVNDPIPACEQKPSIELTSEFTDKTFSVGETVHITWTTTVVDEIVIYRSIDGGQTWPELARVDTASESWGDYAWKIGPDDVCTKCKLRIESYFREAPTETGFFAITSSGSGSGGGSDVIRNVLSGGCSTSRGAGTTGLFWIALGALAFVLLSRRRYSR